MSQPLLRVDYHHGYDLLRTDGTLDFDGGTLIVWRDNSRTHLLKAYGPGSGWTCEWDQGGESGGEIRAELGGVGGSSPR